MTDKDMKMELNMEELDEVNGGVNLSNVTARKIAKSAVMDGKTNKKASGLVSLGKIPASKLGNVEISTSPEIKELNGFDGPTLI
jgi:hypothetical protein